MIILINGASHTGKTFQARKLLEKYNYNYLSIDLLKMGLIKSGYTNLTAEDDNELTSYLWPIIKNIIITALENKQDLVIEGGYIPFGYEKDFTEEQLKEIKLYTLVMSEEYIKKNFKVIKEYSNVAENRINDDWFTLDFSLKENKEYLEKCIEHNYDYVLINENFDFDKTLF